MKPGRMDEDDLTFIPELEAAVRRRGHRFAYILSLLVFIFLMVAITWADNAVIDEVTRGLGKVVPSSRVQVIQNLEGGIIAEILVRENQIVKQGDILLRIDNKRAEVDYREKRNQYLVALAVVTRLQAELANRAPDFPEEVRQGAPRVVRDQIKLHNARKLKLRSELTILRSQAKQREQEIAELESRRDQLAGGLVLAKQQRDIAKPLAARGIYPKVDYIRLERDVQDTGGELRTVKLSIPRAQTALSEARQRIGARRAELRAETTSELNDRFVEMESLKEIISEGKDRVTRTEVRSPVRGTVKQIYQNTIGGVIKPGENIMEIVPLDDTLLIEADVRPADIAFLRPGQEAMIKITAYDFSIYGGLKAKLEQISADTIQNEEGESFYRILLRTKENRLIYKGAELPIIPGMVASADILTGRKTVLDYLLKPILKAKQNALTER